MIHDNIIISSTLTIRELIYHFYKQLIKKQSKTMIPSLPLKQQQNHDQDNNKNVVVSDHNNTNNDMMYDVVQIIRICRLKERDYKEDEIQWFIQQFTTDKIPKYQMSAWLMAVCINGLSSYSTSILTKCMVQSGIQLQWNNQLLSSSSLPNDDVFEDDNNNNIQKEVKKELYYVDKHSTGGVGDKVSIILAPLVAVMGEGYVKVAMMAGRGLGHTGGTIDKLESIPGMNVSLSVNEFQNIVNSESSCSITSTTNELCPADSKLYALRDVTDTVSSISLQTASIMSKKIAENPNSIVLDVKYGLGSFQSNLDDAILLANSMITTGELNGLNPTTAFLTCMDQPIGRAIGNWLEIRECIYLMTPSTYDISTITSTTTDQQSGWEEVRLCYDLIQLVLVQAAEMLYQSGGKFQSMSLNEIMKLSFDALKDGRVLTAFRQMVVAQGGDPTNTIDNPNSYPYLSCTPTTVIVSPSEGYIVRINSLIIGQVSVQLGAGRAKESDPIDPGAGIILHHKVGDYIQMNEPLMDVYTKRIHMESIYIERLLSSITFSNEISIQQPSIITHKVTSRHGVETMIVPDFLSL